MLALALEITDESSVKAAFDAAKAKFGTVDVLVNNAGLNASADHFLRDEDVATWWGDFVGFKSPLPLIDLELTPGARYRKLMSAAPNS